MWTVSQTCYIIDAEKELYDPIETHPHQDGFILGKVNY
tara:strand:- start:887 stop:1000 length:114 start_codon:yes stop_codon:yes gene_type:complete